MARPARVSTDRILAAAADEFAARGFAGARVDRIARRARVNKAMLYYHFGSKQALYRALLRRTFAEAAARLSEIADGADPPDVQMDRAIDTLAAFMREHHVFPRIMLREVAEQGAHLDRDTLGALAVVPLTIFKIVQGGIERGAFQPVNPLVVYLSMVAPIVFYVAAGPIRRELSHRHLLDANALSADDFVREIRQAVHRTLVAGKEASRR